MTLRLSPLLLAAALLPAALLGGCGDRPERDDTGETGDTGDTGQTGDSGETGETGDTGTPGGDGERADWAVYELTVAGRQDGLDLDGDGDTENALWVTGSVLDPVVAQALAVSARVPVLQLSGVGDWTDDEAARLALLTGEDTDGDLSDRAQSGETYAAGAAVDEEGLARASTLASIEAGEFGATLADGTLTLGEYTLDSATDIVVVGAADPDASDGRIGLAIPIDDLLALAAQLGLDTSQVDALSVLADLDTDADGDPDAVSAVFAWRGVMCHLDPG